MESKISVLIVDDSLIFRSLLRDMLSADPEINIIGQAVNGKLAIPRIRHYHPDIVILDQEMPELSGLETLAVIHKDFPDTKVIMFSAHTSEGAKITIEALEAGAVDFLTKPAGKDPQQARESIQKHLLPLIKLVARSVPVSPEAVSETQIRPAEQRKAPAPPPRKRISRGAFSAAAIGISTGGPATLHKMIPLLDPNIRAPIFIVQHMPPIFTKQLADSLNASTELTIVEAESNMLIEPGTVYIAPGAKHMVLKEYDSDRENSGSKRVIVLDTPPEDNCKPSVNILFRSVAEVYGDRAVGVIMTGMGNDGYAGMLAMKEQGAYLLGQNKESCLIYGMPFQITEEGTLNESLDITGIASRLSYLLGAPV